MDTVIASGCELMSKYTISSDVQGTLPNGENAGHPITQLYLDRYGMPNQMVSAQAIANQWKITKEECQDFAIASHEKALKATKECYFKKEIMPVRGLDKDGNKILCDTDEPMRAGVTREGLDSLKVLPGTEWMTAGLSSTVTDGVSAILLMSGEKVKKLGLTPLARVVANDVVGSDPKLMLTGPMTATPKVLKMAGLKTGHIGG